MGECKTKDSVASVTFFSCHACCFRFLKLGSASAHPFSCPFYLFRKSSYPHLMMNLLLSTHVCMFLLKILIFMFELFCCVNKFLSYFVAGQFSCEIESDGRVHIRGLLTGGRTITKQSRVFQMKIRQLCSPGPFTLSFSLPGPVDPRLFAPNFRSDGIFEGVVIKH